VDDARGITRLDLIGGAVASGAVGADAAAGGPGAVREATMTTATIDRLQVHYLVKGSGPALLMLAPGGFDAHMEKWATAGVWEGIRPLDTLANDFTIVAYDRASPAGRAVASNGSRGRSSPIRRKRSSITSRSARRTCWAAAWGARSRWRSRPATRTRRAR
jgi:hypothetical protein